MRWPETCKLIDRIRRERPELTVDHHTSGGTREHYCLRLYCIRKDGRRLIPESLDTIYGPGGWKAYLECNPQPWCKPEESYHTDAQGREVDHRGHLVQAEPLPDAPPITAEEMLERIVTLNRSDRDWRKKPEALAEMAAAWGARTKDHGIITGYEREEVARLSGDCHASILIARTGCGLFTIGVQARWGDGGTILEPSIGSVPFDTVMEARRAAYKELIATLEAGRGAARHQQRQLLLAAVKERETQRGLFG